MFPRIKNENIFIAYFIILISFHISRENLHEWRGIACLEESLPPRRTTPGILNAHFYFISKLIREYEKLLARLYVFKAYLPAEGLSMELSSWDCTLFL